MSQIITFNLDLESQEIIENMKWEFKKSKSEIMRIILKGLKSKPEYIKEFLEKKEVHNINE